MNPVELKVGDEVKVLITRYAGAYENAGTILTILGVSEDGKEFRTTDSREGDSTKYPWHFTNPEAFEERGLEHLPQDAVKDPAVTDFLGKATPDIQNYFPDVPDELLIPTPFLRQFADLYAKMDRKAKLAGFTHVEAMLESVGLLTDGDA